MQQKQQDDLINMNIPKRHHYLPISYLNGFTQSGRFWIFDRENSVFRQQTPINTGLEKNLNTYTDKFGEKQTIESELAAIEGKTKKILNKLDQRQLICEPEKEILSQFVSLLWIRTPVYGNEIAEIGDHLHKNFAKKLFASEEQAQAIINRLPPKERSNVTAKGMVDFVQNEKYQLVPDADDVVTTRISTAIEHSKSLIALDWLFVYSPKKEPFLTTDDPYTLIFPQDIQLKGIDRDRGSHDLISVIPLSQKTCLILNSAGMFGAVSASKHNAREINTKLVEGCNRFVICCDHGILKHLVKKTGIDKSGRKDSFRPIDLFRMNLDYEI